MGGVYKLSIRTMSDICERYNEGLETFEKVLIIERLMYPSIVRGIENASKAKEDK